MIQFLQRLSEVAKTYPSRAAVVDRDGERTTSYAALNDCSSRVAAYLKTLGLQKEQIVAIRLEKSMEYVAVELGVMKCGCAFSPISDAIGEERIAHVLSDSKATLVFDSGHWDKAMECPPLPEADWADSDEHDLAFIIYTSGSTGTPKGVAQEYGVYRFMTTVMAEGILAPYSMDDDAIRFANVAPVTFVVFTDFALCAIYEAWTDYLVPDATVKNPAQYIQFLKNHRIDAMFLTASLAKVFPDNKNLPLKVMYVASERVSDVYSSHFDIRNCYGSTEIMPVVCSFVIDKPYSNTPIGEPCSCTDMILLDNGVVSEKKGEICLCLPYFRGYRNQQEENEKVFVTIEGKRFFRTRDIARRGEDGLLYVLGRTDDMVKINGNRVEPAEVEAALKKVLETKFVAVKAFEKNSKHYLCAYYQKERVVPEEEIRNSLKTLLPAYMIPSYFVRFEKMPLNTNGKVDKATLTPPVFSESHAEYAPPETKIQRILCAAAEKVLGEFDCIGKIGLDDDLMLLGCDSVSAINILVECKGLPLTVPLIFEKRTVRGIAEVLMSKTEPTVQKEPAQTKVPLNDMQLYMLRFELPFPGTVMYNIAFKFTLKNDVDLSLFARAVRKTISAHPALLSVIEKEGDSYYLRYEPSFDKEIPVETMSADELAAAEKSFVSPFLLDGSPLFRTRIIKTAEQSVFLFDAYHGILDGTSVKILMSDIARSLHVGSLPEDRTFYALQEEANFKQSQAFSRDMEYFKNRYGGDGWHTRPLPDFDTDKNILGSITGDFPFTSANVAVLCQRYALGKNEFYAVAAALAIALYNKAQNVMFTWVWNGRKKSSLQRSVGVFIKEFPIAFAIGDATKLKDLLLQAKEQIFASLAHGTLSYGTLDFDGIELYQGPEDLCLLYQGDMYDYESCADFMKEAAVPLDTDEFPRACDNSPELEILECESTFGFNLDYNAAAYKRESMERFLRLFVASCKMLIKTGENPDFTVGGIICGLCM
ncbi:MAG: non-ribosomal peptide synthetase [Treponema sp.]|nr:non-ribosomal peptide synthetase [Treponema sp.]